MQFFEDEIMAYPKDKDLLFHGDNYGTTQLLPSLMWRRDIGNNQVGVGIYFTPNIEVAEGYYGSKLSCISKKGLKFVNNEKALKDVIPISKAVKFIKYLHKNCENFWYIFGDYGFEITNSEDIVTNSIYINLQKIIEVCKISDWQLELAQYANDSEVFVVGWNKFFDIDGLYNPKLQFYAVINPDIPVTPLF